MVDLPALSLTVILDADAEVYRMGYGDPEALESKRLRVGDRLPAERTLAADLGLSRASVREALRVLEAMGVIRPATVPLCRVTRRSTFTLPPSPTLMLFLFANA